MNLKEVDSFLLNPDFAIEFLRLLSKYGIVSEVEVRNALIRKDYFIAKQNKERVDDFMERIAEKYNCTPKNINSIVYGKPRKKYRQVKVKYAVNVPLYEDKEIEDISRDLGFNV